MSDTEDTRRVKRVDGAGVPSIDVPAATMPSPQELQRQGASAQRLAGRIEGLIEAGGRRLAEDPDYMQAREYDGPIGALRGNVRRAHERVAQTEAPPDAATRRKQERRQALAEMIGGIGDMAAHISNLVFTNRYAPNAEVGTRMADAQRARGRQRAAEIAAKEREYWEAVGGYERAVANLNQMEVAQAQARGARAAAAAERQRLADDARRRNEREEELHPYRVRAAKADAESREQDAKDRPRLNAAKEEQLKRVGTGGSGRPAEHAWLDKNGVTVHYEHSEAAARSQAAVHGGQYLTTPTRTSRTVTDEFGESKTTHEVRDTSTPSPKRAVMVNSIAENKSTTTKKKDVTD